MSDRQLANDTSHSAPIPFAWDTTELQINTVHAKSIVVQPSDISLPILDAIRIAHQMELLILYDVSPGNITAQQLTDELQRYPQIVICDHHNACAPMAEMAGKELTAAEVIVNTMPRLLAAGRLSNPANVLIATHADNIDPDAFISRFLIQSFLDPARRRLVWGNQETLQLLVNAARYGDTTFFGGIKETSAQVEQLSPEGKLALALFQLINDEKEKLVVSKRSTYAVIAVNKWLVLEDMVRQGLALNAAVEGRSIFNRIAEQELGIAPDNCIMIDYLAKRLGTKFISLFSITNQMPISQFEFQERSNSQEAIARFQRRRIISMLTPQQVREVFMGRSANDSFGREHGAYWNSEAIESISFTISERIYELLQDSSLTEELAYACLADIARVKIAAARHTATLTDDTDPTHTISVTNASTRLDREEEKSFHRRYLRIYDWLREASSAFGESWLHIMVRQNSLVVSARFNGPHEKRPTVNLAHAHVQQKLNELEAVEAGKKSEVPTRFLIKSNLWLSMGKPHVRPEQLAELIFQNWNEIFSQQSETANFGTSTVIINGRQVLFDGARFAVLGVEDSLS